MLTNPILPSEVENGTLCLARRSTIPSTPWSISACGTNFRKTSHLQYYDAGHMMYLRDEEIYQTEDNIAGFIAVLQAVSSRNARLATRAGR